jgi:hypothetical protein
MCICHLAPKEDVTAVAWSTHPGQLSQNNVSLHSPAP